MRSAAVHATSPAPIAPVVSGDGGDAAATHLARLAETLLRLPSGPVRQALQLLLEARANGRRVYVFGNGGSAAIASHLVCDLTKTAARPGVPPLRSVALTDNVPLLTAWANDAAYEHVYAAQVEMLVDRDDVVIAISSSGRSPNILAAIRSALSRGARVIGLVGFDGGPALELVDVAIHVPVHDYGIVEDAHAAVAHALTAAVKAALDDGSRLSPP